jgi:hypothetical protein
LLKLADRQDLKLSESELEQLEPLEKGAMARLYPFNPTSLWNKEGLMGRGGIARKWLLGGSQENRAILANQIPEEARQRSLHRLTTLTQVRRNPVTAQREFLLHRAVGNKEGAISDTHFHTDDHSSWTPDKTIAFNMLNYYKPTYHKVVSAWIPEQHVRGYFPMLGDTKEAMKPASTIVKEEKEVFVSPGQFELHR